MFYDNLKSHRVAAGLKISELARLTGLGETTVRRIERHDPSTVETLRRIINALNETKFYQNRNINPDVEITTVSRFGSPNNGIYVQAPGGAV